MSAWDDLVRIFSYTDSGVLDDMFARDKNIGVCAKEVLDKHAHELAEKQRAWAAEQGGKDIRVEPGELPDIVQAAVGVVADLIDPESEEL